MRQMKDRSLNVSIDDDDDTATVMKIFCEIQLLSECYARTIQKSMINIHMCMCFSSLSEGEDKAESKGQGGEREGKTPDWTQLAP